MAQKYLSIDAQDEEARPNDFSKARTSDHEKCHSTGIPGGFSTLLRSFQIFNLVSVLVNVSINREDERKPEKKSRDARKTPDYYQDIFGQGNEDESEKAAVVDRSLPRQRPQIKRQGLRIPILFRIEGSDRIEIFTASTSYTYVNLVAEISELASSSLNCKHIEAVDEANVVEIDIDWDIGEGRDWPKRTRLTERNCEAVLLLMERGMMGVLEVKLRDKREVEEEREG